ncbi:MAG: ATP-binding cassette domain-containing protein [Clostridia bacterium]|nr:ATP-binding cassette domain-containing protein [Clostridia bacterium]
MESKYTVVAENVTKMYKMYSKQSDKLKDLFLGRSKAHEFYALKGVSFTAEAGDSVGLIGLNGSGKSTLANIIGGISTPTEGKIILGGEPSLISVGAGMNLQMTGRENVYYKGLLIGLTPKEIDEIMGKVIEFADIGSFFDQPMKVYSSGMRARLGFAISVNIDPEILIIDEALSVGDPSFTQKCLDRMNAFRAKDKTIFFVSHSLPQMKEFCNKVLWLEYGVRKAFGPVDEVLPLYEHFIQAFNKMSPKEKKEYTAKVIENHSHMLITD